MSHRVSFAKIVATPTPTAWSQAYNAGNVFALLALSSETNDELHFLGKDIIKLLEEEYFTLEEKKLQHIKQAVEKALANVPPEVTTCLLVAAVVKQIVYVFQQGNGAILLKRKDDFGSLLAATDNSLHSASGTMQHGDVLVLATKEFASLIRPSELGEVLSNQSIHESAETLAPKIHGNENGLASAMFISVATDEQDENAEFALEEEDEEIAETPILEPKPHIQPVHIPEEPQQPDTTPHHSRRGSKRFALALIHLPKLSGLGQKQQIYALLAIGVALCLVVGIWLTLQQKQHAKLQSAFQDIYPSAEGKYKEGLALQALNHALSQSDFATAKQMLEQKKDTFPQNTTERQKFDSLLSNVNQHLDATAPTQSTPTSKAHGQNALLEYERKNPQASYATTDGKTLYYLDTSGLHSQDTSGNNSQQVAKTSDLPSSIGGLGTYLENIYLVDKSANKITKLVSTEQGIAKTNYLSDTADLSKASGLAIDGSLWVIGTDGTVQKFLRGKKQDFSLQHLNHPLNNPTRIWTSADVDNIYILDLGNSRVVVIDKSGNFTKDYQSPLLKDAKDIALSSDNKLLYFLASGSVWKLTL